MLGQLISGGQACPLAPSAGGGGGGGGPTGRLGQLVAGSYACRWAPAAGRMGIVVPAWLARFWGGAGVGSGAWVPAWPSSRLTPCPGCLTGGSPAGTQVLWHRRRAGLICPSCARGRGSQVRRPAGG